MSKTQATALGDMDNLSDGDAAVLEAPGEPRLTKIILEDNDQIPPGGQFIGADGMGYRMRPGEEVMVPDSVLNVLDTAVMSVPVVDAGNTVIGYRDRLRFPYRVISGRRTA